MYLESKIHEKRDTGAARRRPNPDSVIVQARISQIRPAAYDDAVLRGKN